MRFYKTSFVTCGARYRIYRYPAGGTQRRRTADMSTTVPTSNATTTAAPLPEALCIARMIHTTSGIRNGIGVPRRLVDGVGSDARGGWDGRLPSGDTAGRKPRPGTSPPSIGCDGRSAVSIRRAAHVVGLSRGG